MDLSPLPFASLRNYSKMPQEKGGEKRNIGKPGNPECRDYANGRDGRICILNEFDIRIPMGFFFPKTNVLRIPKIASITE